MTTPTPRPASAPATGGVQTVRRVITYILLFIVVVIAAIGLSGLLERLLEVDRVLAYDDTFGLAQSLTFALIAGPLAALLWWLSWRETASARDRASVAWAAYLMIASTIALLTFTISLFTWVAEAVTGNVQLAGIAVPIVWGLVWLWHYWMWRHPAKGPTRMVGVAPALASLIGLTFAAGGLILALSSLIDSAIGEFGTVAVVERSVWQPIAQSLVWAVGGGLLWWWHWFRVGVRTHSTGFANVLLVYIAGFASFALFASGVTLTLATVLKVVAGTPEPLVITLSPLGIAISSTVFGALILVYHARVIAAHPPIIGSATRLVSSGVSLAVAASGVGVTVNALLATFARPLVDYDIRNLLLGGLSAVLVGGVMWWVTWKPLSASAPERLATPGRRVYLVVIFGVSALVALITLLVIGFQLFSFVLDGSTGETFLERSRQSLGLLSATLFVAAYHFAIWRRERTFGASQEKARKIERVTLVTSSSGSELVTAIRSATGAVVTVLRRADAVVGEPSAEALMAALDGIESSHVLVITGVSIEVIHLAD